jgi:hypothetical protein
MKYLYFFVLLSFGLSGCVKNNPPPVWLEINEWALVSNPDSDPNNPPGALTHNFTEVWVYVDGKIMGVFEVPCKIPVLASGNCKILLYPAMKNNGQASTKKIYPFAEPFETTMELVEGDTYSFNPVTRYISNTKFWIEDFEGSSINLVKDATVSNQNLEMSREGNPAIGPWGNYGHLSLNTSDSLWVGVTDMLQLPKSGAEVYLEFDYMNSNTILTGLIETQFGGATVQHGGYTAASQNAATMKWRKIYIDLKEVVSNTPNGIGYRQYLRMLLDPGLSSSEVYIDNIKVVHF